MSGKSIAKTGLGIAGWLAFLLFGGLIVRNSVGYFHSLDAMPFLMEKEEVSQQGVWRVSLVLHVAAGILCMAAAVMQFFRGITRRWPAMHRWLGRTYAWSVIWVVCPTGFYLALYAKGGLPGQTGFMVLGVITLFTTWRGVAEMKAGRTRPHVRWMIRSFAMVTSAITFRLCHLAFSFTDWAYETNYLASLWLSILGNGAIGECLARMIPLNAKQQTTETHQHETHIHDPLLGRAGNP